jgi:uncharacterized membrane-anchored protein YhcB (DUF1043 family)
MAAYFSLIVVTIDAKQARFSERNSMKQQEKNLKLEITQPNLQQFQQELSGRNSMSGKKKT